MEATETFSHVNDAIRGLATSGPSSETWEFFCECADAACHVLVSLTLLEFDSLRAASPAVPILGAHHEPVAA
ncbi:MAG TPA: hypothetical protein VGG88_12610 [Gaiellaceae bacterium]|jgi:hypothetical protein